MTREPRVYITNKGAHDHSDAERFGSLVFLSEGPVSRYSLSRMYREAAYALCDSIPEDYILDSGLREYFGMVCAILAMQHKRINVLIYKPSSKPGKDGKYLERIIMLEELLGESK